MFKKIATMIALTFAISSTAMASSEFNPDALIANAETSTGLQLHHRPPPPRPPPHRRPPPKAVVPSIAVVVVVCATIIILASLDDDQPHHKPQPAN